MAETGRLVAFYGAGEPMRIEEYPVPEPEPGAIVVRTTLANVCGSDMHVWRGEQDLKKMGRALPRHMGHEQCGRVHALGDGVTTDSAGAPLAIGDRVVFRYAFACGRCRACLSGKTRCCPNQMRHTATPCTAWPHFKGACVDHEYEPHIALIRDERPERPEIHRPRRWVVERTLVWLSKFRAILVRWDKKAENYLGLLVKCLRFGLDLWDRCARRRAERRSRRRRWKYRVRSRPASEPVGRLDGPGMAVAPGGAVPVARCSNRGVPDATGEATATSPTGAP